jgi:UDPglucose 6-dehydrogenase
MQGYKVVATKSTVPVGTADKVRLAIEEELKRRGDARRFFGRLEPRVPQRGRGGRGLHAPDRVVVGADDERAIAMLRQLYAPFQRNRDRIIVMGVRSAELTKYAANACSPRASRS